MTHFRAHPGETFAEASLFSVSWGWAAPHGFKPNVSGGKEARRCDPPCKGGREPTPEPAYGSVREQRTHEQARITSLAMALSAPAATARPIGARLLLGRQEILRGIARRPCAARREDERGEVVPDPAAQALGLRRWPAGNLPAAEVAGELARQRAALALDAEEPHHAPGRRGSRCQSPPARRGISPSAAGAAGVPGSVAGGLGGRSLALVLGHLHGARSRSPARSPPEGRRRRPCSWARCRRCRPRRRR